MSIIIICPGIHHPELTKSFVEELKISLSDRANLNALEKVLIFPAQDNTALSAFHILQFLLENTQPASPVLFISFSAGVVGALGAAWGWQLLGRDVLAFIALDGWGVPLVGNFPIYRLSHDHFTHWSSSLLGNGEDSFYAEPAVEHLELWRSPQQTSGWWVSSSVETQTRLTAAQFLTMLIER